MNVTFIHHSSFLVEEASVFLLFDYTEGQIPPLPKDAPLYVLASHGHGDHFSPAIFALAKEHPNVRFLLSSDIPLEAIPEEYRNEPDMKETLSPDLHRCKPDIATVPQPGGHRTSPDIVTFLQPGEIWKDNLLQVETFASNDQGIAFWCTVGDRQIYHAGDLNNWFWEGDEEDLRLQELYRIELQKMAGRTADAAFVPLDPRLGDAFFLGVDDFMRYVKVKNLFPMHFWGDFSVSERLIKLPCTEGYRHLIRAIHRDGECFTV
ncbi:MAG: MBL fold metallo-hydrolase [Lachnospiraceae bacterium]|nr:MBL fold metallo-hydrolase [Lachnospiraceae bacterium]